MKTVRDLKRFYLQAFLLTIALSAVTGVVASHLILNQTDSLPLGWYWLQHEAAGRGELVAFPVPVSVQGMVHERGYLQDGAYLLKVVVATAGDHVCTDGGVFAVNGRVIGRVLVEDSAGRSLPHAQICSVVGPDEVYVASDHPRSFDSRVFGAIRVADIRGKVVPLWTY